MDSYAHNVNINWQLSHNFLYFHVSEDGITALYNDFFTFRPNQKLFSIFDLKKHPAKYLIR